MIMKKRLCIIVMLSNTTETITEQQRYHERNKNVARQRYHERNRGKCLEKGRRYYEKNEQRLQKVARD